MTVQALGPSKLALLLRDIDVCLRKQGIKLHITIGVSRQQLTAWCNDRSLPPPEKLRAMLQIAKNYKSTSALRPWVDELLKATPHTVSPHWKKIGRSLHDYSLKANVQTVMGFVSGLPVHRKEEALQRIVAIVDQILLEESGEPLPEDAKGPKLVP
ncbi:MAG: hypothetical protein JWN50_288 [Parcubacteria group bacterium]|nr:hypothetical protein [Parcubacteria group bacterium]